MRNEEREGIEALQPRDGSPRFPRKDFSVRERGKSWETRVDVLSGNRIGQLQRVPLFGLVPWSSSVVDVKSLSGSTEELRSLRVGEHVASGRERDSILRYH